MSGKSVLIKIAAVVVGFAIAKIARPYVIG